MSFTFTIPGPGGTGVADLLALAAPSAATVEDELPASGWPGWRVHAYLPGRSVRSVELFHDGDSLDVRLMTNSAPEDHELGVTIAATAARLDGTTVTSEDGWELGPDELAVQFGPTWVADQVASGARIAMTLAADRGPITMGGPIRDFHMGARLAAELRAAGPDDDLPERLVVTMRRVQWPGEDYYPASVFQTTGKESGATATFAVWAGVACIIPKVELVVLSGPGEHEPVPVPLAAVAGLAGDRATRLDEFQLLLDGVPDADWPAVLAAADTQRVPLPG
jgi:hypothetical protein